MFKPLIFILTISAAISACSKKDDAASNNVPTPPANAVSTSEDAARDAAERNRDSTKQQQDAVGTLAEATKPN